jgi:hypothetical protein
MSSTRAWLFRVLVLASGGLLLYSWFQPWWSARVMAVVGEHHVVIHPFGLEVILEDIYNFIDVAAADIPAWVTPVMWAYLAIAIAALLFSLWAKDKELKLWKVRFTLPSWTIGIVGFSYIVVAVTMFIIATMKTADLGIPLIGITETQGFEVLEGLSVSIKSDLQLGYWLAYGAGTLLILLALLRNKIIGRSDQ